MMAPERQKPRLTMADLAAQSREEVAHREVPATPRAAVSQPRPASETAQAPLRALRSRTAPPKPASPPAGHMAAHSAMEAVLAARDSVRDDPRAWVPFTIKIPAALAHRLVLRWASDRKVTRDRALALSHYHSAALAQVPAKPEKAAAWARAWRARAGRVGEGALAGSGSRLHRDVANAMSDLAGGLRTLEKPVRAWEVHAEALARLLDALDGLEKEGVSTHH